MPMKVPFEGGCACGAVRYKVTAKPIVAFLCHCRDCQHASGGGHAPALLVPAKAFSFTKGQPKYHARPSAMGGHHIRGFCAECGSRLTGGQKNEPTDWVGVTAASLDDPSKFKPEMHFFVAQAQPWDTMDDDLPKHDYYPPR